MQRALQNKRSGTILAIDAVTLCKAAERELLNSILEQGNTECRPGDKQTKKRSLSALIKGVELAFHLVHRTLHRVSGAKSDNQCKGQVTYYLVCLFESIITALTQHCARPSDSANPSTRAVAGTTNTSQSAQHSEKEFSSDDEETTVHSLTELLCTMALSLDLARPEDREVMEGFLFVAFSRVGKLLALFTFSKWRSSPDIRPRPGLPVGLTAIRMEKLTPRNAQLEAKHLLVFLNNVLSCGPETSTTQSQLVQPMKERLYKSLLQAVFGDDDPFFKDGLTRPAIPPPQTCDTQQVDEDEFSEWFTEGLWRLVGWDMLSSLVRGS